MSARERERGELPSPDLSLSDCKVGQGLFVFGKSGTFNIQHRTGARGGGRPGWSPRHGRRATAKSEVPVFSFPSKARSCSHA